MCQIGHKASMSFSTIQQPWEQRQIYIIYISIINLGLELMSDWCRSGGLWHLPSYAVEFQVFCPSTIVNTVIRQAKNATDVNSENWRAKVSQNTGNSTVCSPNCPSEQRELWYMYRTHAETWISPRKVYCYMEQINLMIHRQKRYASQVLGGTFFPVTAILLTVVLLHEYLAIDQMSGYEKPASRRQQSCINIMGNNSSWR